MSQKTRKRMECFINAIITTYIAVLIWCLVEHLILGNLNPNNVDTVMIILFFLYVYWRNMKEATNEMEKKITP